MYRDFTFHFSDGNSITFETVVNIYTPSLIAFAFGFINEMENSKDIVQEVFLNLWLNKTKFNDEEHLKRSLYISVKNISFNNLRSVNRQRKYLSNIEDTYTPDPTLSMMKQEVIRLLLDAINDLPERTAEVLRLTLSGYKQEEIADRMGIAVSSVKTMKRSGIDKIKEKYGFVSAFLLIFFG